jgi:RHS repeat-associated protein
MRWRNRRRVRRCASGRSIYNYFRDFDPATGRYVESDPIGLWGGSYSTYAYANGNSLSKIDPLGLAPPGRTSSPGVSIPLPIPPIAIPGSPENRAWANSALQQIEDALRKAAQAIQNACSANSEDARCQKVYKDCAGQCADTFADNPENLPGTGRDYAARVRRCIAECVKAGGCSPFKVR